MFMSFLGIPTFVDGSFLTLRLVVYYSMLGEMLTKIGQSNVYKFTSN